MFITCQLRDANFNAMLSDILCGNGGIIKLPNSAEYSLEDVLNVLQYAATSQANSIEAASVDLKRKNRKGKIVSEDTIHDYIKTNDCDTILSFFRNTNSELLKWAMDPNKAYDVAIDFHNIGYYGEKNTECIRGIKPTNGTSWGYTYMTIDIIKPECKFTSDIINIFGLTKNYQILIESLLQRTQSMGIKIEKALLDKEFFNNSAILALHNLNIRYIMGAKENQKIKRIIKDYKNKHGKLPGIFPYSFKKSSSPKFNIVVVPNPNYKKEKDNREYFLFATNINYASASEFIKNVPIEYKKRWNIETGYRVKNEFKIRTCSKSPVTRTLLFVIQCIMYNFLCVFKRVLSITAYLLKSIVSEDILNNIVYGIIKPIMVMKNFWMDLMKYDENRNKVLKERLKYN